VRAVKYGDQGGSNCETSRRRLLDSRSRSLVGRTYVPNKVGKSALRVLQCIHEYCQEHGFAPSMREICEQTGLRSSATVNTHVCTLAHHGLLRHKTGQSRAYSLTPAGLEQVE